MCISRIEQNLNLMLKLCAFWFLSSESQHYLCGMEKALGYNLKPKLGVFSLPPPCLLSERKSSIPHLHQEVKIIETVPKEEGIFSRTIYWSHHLAPGLYLYRANRRRHS